MPIRFDIRPLGNFLCSIDGFPAAGRLTERVQSLLGYLLQHRDPTVCDKSWVLPDIKEVR